MHSKIHHPNLVKLHGIIKSPLRMVIEYVPESDLHRLLENSKEKALPMKWRLKLAIDCASGMRYF